MYIPGPGRAGSVSIRQSVYAAQSPRAKQGGVVRPGRAGISPAQHRPGPRAESPQGAPWVDHRTIPGHACQYKSVHPH